MMKTFVGRVESGLLHLLHEHLSGFEGRNLVLRNDDNGVLADVAGGLL